MKKKISIALCLLLILISTTVFASTPVKMEIVENNICNIKLNENSKFEKKIISSELDKKQVTLQLQINNDAINKVPEGELMLVIDNSSSMTDKVGEVTRKDLVLNSANKLIENLLALNSSTLKIGIVSFSSSSEVSEQGTEKDAKLISNFTNDFSILKEKINSIEGTGAYTDLDAGLKLAKKTFSTEDNNKYLIVLTDGLPNMCVGSSDLVSVEALEKVISTTNETLKSLKNINVISLLTGISSEEAVFKTDTTGKSYTYGQVIQGVFGTTAQPTIGKFYKINDNEIEKTITEQIYADLVPVEQTLKDITIVDYFPQYIIDNFEMAYVEGMDALKISSEIDKETNSITWTIPELKAKETLKVQYTLTLKDEFNEKMIDQILDTNQKVEINYKDFDNTEKTTESTVTPKLKLTAIKAEEPKTEPTITEPTKDETKAPEELPKTGAPILFGFITVATVSTIAFAVKSKKFNF